MLVYFFYLFVGVLGLVTTSIIFIQYKSNRTINLYLILLFGIISIRFLIETVFYFYKNLIPNFSYFPFFSILIPLFYLYIKNIIANSRQHKLKEVMGHSDIKVSLTYLRGLDVPKIREEDMPTF